MHTFLIDLMACPACHDTLEWVLFEQHEDRIETAQARCTACGALYPVRDGIGLFLTPDLPREDLWEQAESGLIRYLREHPETERQLMDVPLDALNPADQMFRALVLEDRGSYAEAKLVADRAMDGLYTAEYLACAERQVAHVVERLAASDGPVVDLASGRGYLVEALARRLQRPVVATDFSPRVLRRARPWLESLGLYNQVSLLAFDARRTPFKDGAVSTLTTYLGLPNIREPGGLLRELRRVVGGTFLAISYFSPEPDPANPLLHRATALEQFRAAGWQVEIENVCHSIAQPTPVSAILEGARIDAFPVAETTVEWGVLVAR